MPKSSHKQNRRAKKLGPSFDTENRGSFKFIVVFLSAMHTLLQGLRQAEHRDEKRKFVLPSGSVRSVT